MKLMRFVAHVLSLSSSWDGPPARRKRFQNRSSSWSSRRRAGGPVSPARGDAS